jgi:peptide/nickel transport system substrate-binding protein
VPEKPDPNLPQRKGGVYAHGATGGGLTDTLDAHFPVTTPDIARVNNPERSAA